MWEWFIVTLATTSPTHKTKEQREWQIDIMLSFMSSFTFHCSVQINLVYEGSREWSWREKEERGTGEGYAVPYSQPLKADNESWLPDDFSVFINALLPSFPKDYLQLLSFPWIVFSSLVPEGSISLNVFHRHLLFVSNLDLRTVGYRVSSSQLSGISWMMLANPQSFSLLQFTLILGWSGILKNEIVLRTVAQRMLKIGKA